jgi:hypothetical protein
MKVLKLFCLTIFAGLMLVGSVAAEEMKFRAMLMQLSRSKMDIPAFKGHAMGAAKFAGFAVFEDGRIAYKTSVVTSESMGDTGTSSGYSSYIFQNGDALVVKLTGRMSPDGSSGDYKVVSGTGAYEGATGTGRGRR